MTDELRKAEAFQDAMDKLKTEMEALQNKMMNSVPFYSSRYKVTKHFDHQLNEGFKLRFRDEKKQNKTKQKTNEDRDAIMSQCEFLEVDVEK